MAIIAFLIYLFLTTKDFKNLQSLVGIPSIILIACFLSVKPSKVLKIKLITNSNANAKLIKLKFFFLD